MRKLFLVIASIFTVLGIVFAFLPLGTLALLPIGIALLFGFLTLQKSDLNQKKLVKVLLLFSVLSLVAVVGKELVFKDEVEKDVQFEKVKIESKKEDKKELEELENDLE
jgi:signal transduction histidine kinase